VCVVLRFIGRSLRLSAAVVVQQRCRYARVCEAAVVLSHDTSICSCSVVASPPSDAVPALWCASTPVMRAAVCLPYVSAVKRRRVAVLHVHPLRHSLAVCKVAVLLLLLLCAERLFARAWRRCVSRCDLRERRCVAGLCGGMTASGTCGLSGCVVLGSLAHGVVRER
jgi:hypothetical protein